MRRPDHPYIKDHSQTQTPVSTHWIGSPRSCNGRGSGNRHHPFAKSISLLLETLIALLHSLSHLSRSLKYASKYLTSSSELRDVAMIAVTSAYNDSSAWRNGTGMSLTYRLNKTGEISPPVLSQSAWHDGWMWPFGSTPRTFCCEGKKIWF
jgi:hypothetical protein